MFVSIKIRDKKLGKKINIDDKENILRIDDKNLSNYLQIVYQDYFKDLQIIGLGKNKTQKHDLESK